jgi:hypothetical protein
MKIAFKVFTITALLVILASTVLPSQSQAISTEQTTKNVYHSFLENVLCLDFTKYNLTNSGYGTSYPPKFGGVVKEETISYTLDSAQSTVNTWATFDNGAITTCSMYATRGSVAYSKLLPTNVIDSTKDFIQKYEKFLTQFYSKDTSYLQQVLSSLDGVNAQASTNKNS